MSTWALYEPSGMVRPVATGAPSKSTLDRSILSYSGTKKSTSCPARARCRGSAAMTSASPPVLAYGASSDPTKRMFIVARLPRSRREDTTPQRSDERARQTLRLRAADAHLGEGIPGIGQQV